MAKEHKPQGTLNGTSNRRTGNSSRSKASNRLQTQVLGVRESLEFAHHGVTSAEGTVVCKPHDGMVVAPQSFHSCHQRRRCPERAGTAVDGALECSPHGLSSWDHGELPDLPGEIVQSG